MSAFERWWYRGMEERRTLILTDEDHALRGWNAAIDQLEGLADGWHNDPDCYHVADRAEELKARIAELREES